MLIEVLRGPGTKDRGTWCLRKFLTDAAINAKFINGPPGSIRRTLNMSQQLAHLRSRKVVSSFMDLFEIPLQKRAGGTAELVKRDSDERVGPR